MENNNFMRVEDVAKELGTRVQDYEKSPTLWYGLTTPFRNVTVQ